MEIDTLCYFVEGVESVHTLQKAIFGRNAGPFHERLLELRRSADRALGLVNSVMWSDSLSTYANRLTGGVPEYLGFWTSIVPFVTGLASRDRYLSFVGSRDGLKGMTGPDGLSIGTDRQRTMAIQNGLMSLAASRYDDSATALHFYMSNIPHAGEFMPGVVPEILGDAAGCYLQVLSGQTRHEATVSLGYR